MKKFEIEVVRTYTTTIEVELPDNLTPRDVEEMLKIYSKYDGYLCDEIWDKIGEAELEQMDTDMQSVKAKEL
jgi:hypothetical protein